MASTKISNMTSAVSIGDTDVVPIVQSATNKKTAWSLIKSTLKTYFDTLYALTGATTTSGLTMSTARILGRTTGGTGAIEEITIGTGLSLSAGSLTATGSSAALTEITGNITAANDTNYILTASATITDPSPTQAKGYTIYVRNGTATVDGVAYPTQGTIIYRFYSGGAWVTNTLHHDYITLGLSAASFNPADSTTYYMSDIPTLAPGATATSRKLKLPVPSVLVAARIETIVAGTLAAGDESTTISLRLNNTTDSTISSAVKFTTAAQTLMITGLNISVATTDDFQLKVVTPNFSTNPTTCYISTTLFFQQL